MPGVAETNSDLFPVVSCGVATCPGRLIVHADGTVARCTLDDDEDGCAGRELTPRR